jgi:hypothetical protein
MIFFLIALLIVAIIVIVAFLAPKNYEVKRSIVIDRPHVGVFNYLKYLKNQDHWCPARKRDPDIKQAYEGEDGEVGFILKWKGNDEVGTGEQEITQIVKNKRMEVTSRFLKPVKSTSYIFTIVENLGRMQTKVTWGFKIENKFPMNVLMLFHNMYKDAGNDYETGLKNLKNLLEKN